MPSVTSFLAASRFERSRSVERLCNVEVIPILGTAGAAGVWVCVDTETAESCCDRREDQMEGKKNGKRDCLAMEQSML